MRIRAQLKDGMTEVKVLMSHPMESGFRKDESGKPVPPHFIKTVGVTINGKPVLKAHWGPAVSKNPFLAFRVRGGKAGDKVSIHWVDNKGDSRTDEATVA